MANDDAWVRENNRIRARLAEINEMMKKMDAMAAADHAVSLNYDPQAAALREAASRIMREG